MMCHTGLGSDVRGEPSAADARGAHARHSTLQSSHGGVLCTAGRDFANQSVPIYGLDSRMPLSASSRDATQHDAYTSPSSLGTPASATSFNMASATHSQPASQTPTSPQGIPHRLSTPRVDSYNMYNCTHTQYRICPVTAPHGCGESHAAVLCGACPCDTRSIALTNAHGT